MKAIIVSHNEYGELCVSLNGKEYTYYGVTPYHLKMIRRLIDRRDKNLFNYLKDFSSRKRWREERAIWIKVGGDGRKFKKEVAAREKLTKNGVKRKESKTYG